LGKIPQLAFPPAGIQFYSRMFRLPPEFIPIYIGAGMTGQRIIDGFSQVLYIFLLKPDEKIVIYVILT